MTDLSSDWGVSGDAPARWPTLAAVAFALVGPVLLDALLETAVSLDGFAAGAASLGLDWLHAALVVALVLYWERRPLSSIGVRATTRRDLAWSLAAFVVGVLTFAVTAPVVQVLGLETTGSGIEWLASFPVWFTVLVAITAGVTEEVAFRGYPIERLAELTGSAWVAGGVTLAVFTALHVSLWGVGGALQIGVWTVVVTVLYVRRRNLQACILMHVLNDLFAFVVLPRLWGM
jgi:membrane protease YdiL (CAAX protease family)